MIRIIGVIIKILFSFCTAILGVLILFNGLIITVPNMIPSSRPVIDPYSFLFDPNGVLYAYTHTIAAATQYVNLFFGILTIFIALIILEKSLVTIYYEILFVNGEVFVRKRANRAPKGGYDEYMTRPLKHSKSGKVLAMDSVPLPNIRPKQVSPDALSKPTPTNNKLRIPKPSKETPADGLNKDLTPLLMPSDINIEEDIVKKAPKKPRRHISLGPLFSIVNLFKKNESPKIIDDNQIKTYAIEHPQLGDEFSEEKLKSEKQKKQVHHQLAVQAKRSNFKNDVSFLQSPSIMSLFKFVQANKEKKSKPDSSKPTTPIDLKK